MNALKAELDRFMGESPSANPPEGKLYEFLQHLSADGQLYDYPEADWVEAGRAYGMSDDQVAAWIETAASWLTDTTEEGEREPEQASWEAHGRGSSASVTRGNPGKKTHLGTSARRGTEEFDGLMADLEADYVTAEYPGLVEYAYQADTLSPEDARDVMDEILDNIVEIEWSKDGHPNFRLKGEDRWRSVVDSDDFPQPSAEGGEEEEAEDNDCEKCYDDCKCPVGACDCDPCACGDGCSCCCTCDA